MKVGTDGVLLGAWADVRGCREVVDAGTGTGVIALMAAQRLAADGAGGWHVTAVELDADAAAQAEGNVAASPWHERIGVVQGDFRSLSLPAVDLVLCNPPFFSRSLRCPDEGRSTARHDDSLTLQDLACACARILKEEGRLAVVLPYDRRDEMMVVAASQSLFLSRQTAVCSVRGKEPKRILQEYSRQGTNPALTTLCIEEHAGVYSDEYRALVHDFYLHM